MELDLYLLANNITSLSTENRSKLSKIVFDIDENCRINSLPPAGGSDWDLDEDKFKYDLLLTSPGTFKVRLMSRLCQSLKFSLSEAKEIVYNTPSIVEPSISFDNGQKLIKDLSDEGAEFTLVRVI